VTGKYCPEGDEQDAHMELRSKIRTSLKQPLLLAPS
jgi:hypothetical protein